MTTKRTWKKYGKKGKGRAAWFSAQAQQNPTAEGVGNSVRICRQHFPGLESLLTWVLSDEQSLQYLNCQSVLNLNVSLCIIAGLCRMALHVVGLEGENLLEKGWCTFIEELRKHLEELLSIIDKCFPHTFSIYSHCHFVLRNKIVTLSI